MKNSAGVVILIILFFIWKKDRNWGWLIIMLGGILNLGERLIFGTVNDYWPIPFTGIYNNINDYLIFIGGIMVVWKKLK